MKIDISIASLELITPYIAHVCISDHADFGINELIELKETNQKLFNGKKYCVLIELGRYVKLMFFSQI